MLAVVSLWPLICLKSPKQQTAEARFYCPSMRKGDRATSAWWMGSNWESKGWDKGVVSRHKTLFLPAFTYTETLLFKCIHVWVCVVWITGKLCYQRDSYIPDSLWELDIKQYCTEKLSRMCKASLTLFPLVSARLLSELITSDKEQSYEICCIQLNHTTC